MPYEGASNGKHYWLTPSDLFKKLDEEFHFDFDPCPYPRPEGFDGLLVDWGNSNYVNPPFHGPTAWVRKAIREHQKGKRVVFVFPIDKWIHYFLEAGAQIRNLRDVKWCSIEDGLPGKGTGRHIAAFVLDGKRRIEMSKGTALARAVNFFREGNYDEARVAFQLVSEVMSARAAEVKAQRSAAERSRPKRTRRTKEEIAAAASKQTTIEEGAKAAGAAGTITV